MDCVCVCMGVRVCVCVLGKRHHQQSSHGTLDEPLGCVMFVYLACLPLHLSACVHTRVCVFVCVYEVWLALLATMLGWADGYAYWLNGRIKGEMEGERRVVEGVWTVDEGMLASVAPFGQINSKPLVSVISGSVRYWWREVWIEGQREGDMERESESENKLHLNW